MSDGGRRDSACSGWAFSVRLLSEDGDLIPLMRVAFFFDSDTFVPDLERKALVEARRRMLPS